VLKELKLCFFENVHSRKVDINIDKAIFSFTFDDVPVSAATTGATILEEAGTTGTFYVALGMCDVSSEDYGKFIHDSEILSLYNNGHNIGCHTYSHLNLRKSKTKNVVYDCEKNVHNLRNIIGATSIDHFAYPFGMVSPGGKKALGRRYKTLRTVDHGINSGISDMTHLRSVSLCAITFSRDAVHAAINDAVKNKAWVIFFSHDIAEHPSDWGTTPEDLQWVVDQCLKAGGEILNVDQAFNKIIGHEVTSRTGT
jgi:peptidoglycan/xylan/chitin deacetylase (PgdA/CDA1 family)